MTEFHLASLHVPDVEAFFEYSYFEWGREWGRDVRDPNIRDDSVRDPRWDAASPEQRHTIALRGYHLYDGWPAIPGNEVGALEAYVSVGINSQVVLYDVTRFLSRADEARPLLARIPDHARLEDATDDQLDAAAALIDLFCQAYRVKRGKATKVLHKKRPAFIPVIDSRVWQFLWDNCTNKMKQGSSNRHVLALYSSLLREHAGALQQIQAALAARGFALSTTRILSHMIWHG